MTMEVKEEFEKLTRQDVALYLKSFKANTAADAAEIWKKKSVSIVSPTSGRILKKTKEDRSPSLISNLLGYFKEVKVSDSNEQNNEITHSNKGVWATNVVETNNGVNGEAEVVKVAENVTVFQSSGNIKSIKPLCTPKVTLTVYNESDKAINNYVCKPLHSTENKLKLPPLYNGSKMAMPNGEQCFWVRFFLLF